MLLASSVFGALGHCALLERHSEPIYRTPVRRLISDTWRSQGLPGVSPGPGCAPDLQATGIKITETKGRVPGLSDKKAGYAYCRVIS